MSLRNSSSLLLAASLVSMLAACTPGAPGPVSKADATSSELKLDLRSQAASAKPLTDAQKTELATFVQAQAKNVPASTLYFDSYADPKDKEHDLSALSDASKADVDNVKKNCKVDPGTNTPAELPAVGKSITKNEEQSISGTGCPMTYSTKSTTVTKYSAIDSSTTSPTISSTSHIDGQEDTAYTDDQMKKDVNVTSESFTTSGDIVYTNYTEDSSNALKAGSSYSTMTSKGKLVMADGSNLSMNIQNEFYATVGHTNQQALTTLTLADGVQALLFVKQTDDKTTLLLNGETYTTDDFKAKFGDFGTIRNIKLK